MAKEKNMYVVCGSNFEKMSPQAAVGYGNWPDEDGRQSKWRGKRRGKKKTLRSHRTGR